MSVVLMLLLSIPVIYYSVKGIKEDEKEIQEMFLKLIEGREDDDANV